MNIESVLILRRKDLLEFSSGLPIEKIEEKDFMYSFTRNIITTPIVLFIDNDYSSKVIRHTERFIYVDTIKY